MRLKIFLGSAVALLGFGSLAWWYAIDGSTPGNASYDFQINALRTAASAEADDRPQRITLYDLGRTEAPGFATGFGLDFSPVPVALPAFRLEFSDGSFILIDTPGDRQIIEGEMKAEFYPDQYDRLIRDMTQADMIVITHEHLDHIPIVSRHPQPELIAPKLRLTQPEIDALPLFASDGELPDALKSLRASDFSKATRLAPGVSVLATPGHTKGHVVIFVQTADEKDFLFVGDIVWQSEQIEWGVTRPRILQDMIFDPKEDRVTVQDQTRGLQRLQKLEPDLLILPAHDARLHDRWVEAGLLHRTNR